MGFNIVWKQLGLKKYEKIFMEGIRYVEPYMLVELGLFKLSFNQYTGFSISSYSFFIILNLFLYEALTGFIKHGLQAKPKEIKSYRKSISRRSQEGEDYNKEVNTVEQQTDKIKKC